MILLRTDYARGSGDDNEDEPEGKIYRHEEHGGRLRSEGNDEQYR
jgi:hypothetical protein